MLVSFTPYSFLYSSFYLLVLSSLLTISNFYYYWVCMELLMLLFMGIGYSVVLISGSQLMLYFLIQSVSSFSILVSYVYSVPLLFTFSLLVKLSMFPFCFWYIGVVYSFPNFLVWFASSIHNLPPILLLNVFVVPLDLNVLWISIFLSVLFSGFLILSCMDLRMLLVVSSIGNNSWFLLGQIVSFAVFFIYFFFYALGLMALLSLFSNVSNPISFFTLSPSSYIISFWVLVLAGMPPFPLFFCKILVLYSLFSCLTVNFLVFIFILFSSYIFIGYLSSLIKYFTYAFSCGLYLAYN